MALTPRPIARAVFVGQWFRDDGKTQRPVTAAEVNAEWAFMVHAGLAHWAIQGDGERDLEMLRHLRRFLSRPGRPTAAYHADWIEKLRDRWAEACAAHELNNVDGERPPSRLDIAFEVACDDFAEHPERWRYDPKTRPKTAAQRVWKPVNAYLSAN